MRSDPHPLCDLVAILPAGTPGGAPEQHLDLEILVSYVRSSGWTVRLLDATLHGRDQILHSLQEKRARLVYWHLPSRSELLALKAMKGDGALDLAGAVMVAGGYFATRHDLAILQEIDRLDAIVCGEAEATLLALLEAIRDRRPWWEERGLAARAGGTVARNPPRPLLEDLTPLPAAAPDLFHPSRLSSAQKVLFNRGCDSDCQYCGLQLPYRKAFPARGQFWRSREPQAIVHEIEHFAKSYGVRRFAFNAFVLFGYLSGGAILESVLREILRRRLSIQFSFVTHPDKLQRNRHLLPLLKEAGLQKVYLGIDSGLERALRLYNVDFGLADIYAALAALHEEQVPFDTGLFFFDPYLAFDEIPIHLDFLRRIGPYFAHMDKPFAFYLDRQLLTSALRVNWGMPICGRLEKDGLLVSGADPLERDPAVRFQDRSSGKLFAAHQLTLQTQEMRRLRPELARHFSIGGLEPLPLRMAEALWECVAQDDGAEPPALAERMGDWLRCQPEWANLEMTSAREAVEGCTIEPLR